MRYLPLIWKVNPYRFVWQVNKIRNSLCILAFFLVVPLSFSTSASAAGISTRPIPKRIYGVTIDAVDHLSYIVDSLKSLPRKMTTRIVFDEFVPATYYVKAVSNIYPVSFIMGELLDSYYVKQYSVAQYRSRTIEYLDTLGAKVDIWEIGNEINGEWLGSTASVKAKMKTAYGLVKARGGRTALTLYYNEDCWENPANEMFTWTRANVPEYMKQGLDYVLVSYYDDDCNGLRPDWQAVFNRLGKMFPNSKIGLGEIGTTRKTSKVEYIRRYYGMQINHPHYIGGNFWWYFKQDMVPKSKYLWAVLAKAIR